MDGEDENWNGSYVEGYTNVTVDDKLVIVKMDITAENVDDFTF